MDHHRVWTTASAKETEQIGFQTAVDLTSRSERGADVICLWGELGSGKTTFSQGLARGLGVTARILSPTFIIVRRYEISGIFSLLYHLDLYRLQSEQDVSGIGLSDMLADPAAIIVIEWPERLGALLPNWRDDFRFTAGDGDERHITHETIRI